MDSANKATQFTIIKEQMAKLQKQREEARKDHFKAICTHLFETYPKLQCFSWEQYTPYFNDGDTCYFHVHYDHDIKINDECFGDKNDNDLTYDELTNMTTQIVELLDTMDKDDYKGMFGDHCEITVYKNGNVETNEYSHD